MKPAHTIDWDSIEPLKDKKITYEYTTTGLEKFK